MRDFALTTDVQWAAYQRVWEIGTKFNDVLVSQQHELRGLVGVIPQATSRLDGLGASLEETTGPGLGQRLKDGFSSGVSGLNNIFMSAFEGGGQLLGAVKSFSTQIIGNMMDAIVPGLGQFAGALVAAAGKLWSGIKRIFGGPSENELLGRDVAASFRDGVVDGLSPEQMSEARLAAARGVGSVTGAALHVAIRDAKLAAGATIKEAERAASGMVALLHTAEAKGPEAVAHAQAAIQKILDEAKTATDEAKGAIVEDADEIADRFAHMTSEEIYELREALRAIKPVAVDTFRGIRSSSLGAGVALQQFLVHILAVSRALAAIPRNVTTTITTIQETIHVSSGKPPGRQHGGPVSAGSPYVVGEAGPEIFVPSSSGSVLPNSMAEDIGAAVVKALHRVPLVVPQDPVTDTLYRNGPRRARAHA